MTTRMLMSCVALAAFLNSTVSESAAPAGVMLQLGSFPNAREAEAASARFNTSALGGMATEVRSADLGARGIWYRVLVGPFADRGAADRACVSLKAAGVSCLIAPADTQIAPPAQQATAAPGALGSAGTNLRASITAPPPAPASIPAPAPPPAQAPAQLAVAPPSPASAQVAVAQPPPAPAQLAVAPPPPAPAQLAEAQPPPAPAEKAAAVPPPVETEFSRAMRLAEQGDARAQLQVAGFYLVGRGVPRDETASLRWYRIAAENGLAEAQFEVGKAYDMGRGGARDPFEAARWYRLAAQQGNGRAQYNLGSMHGNGEGVPVDYLRAYMWFSISETTLSGTEQDSARNAKGRAAQLMMPADIERATQMAQRCLSSGYRDCN